MHIVHFWNHFEYPKVIDFVTLTSDHFNSRVSGKWVEIYNPSFTDDMYNMHMICIQLFLGMKMNL